jgi:hypothetical protein
MDWGTALAIFLGASLSFGGGLVARRLEQRRQARVDILHRIADVRDILANLREDPVSREQVIALESQTDRLMRHANIAGWGYGLKTILLVATVMGLLETYGEWRVLAETSSYDDRDIGKKMQLRRKRASENVDQYAEALVELDNEVRTSLADYRLRWRLRKREHQSRR